MACITLFDLRVDEGLPVGLFTVAAAVAAEVNEQQFAIAFGLRHRLVERHEGIGLRRIGQNERGQHQQRGNQVGVSPAVHISILPPGIGQLAQPSKWSVPVGYRAKRSMPSDPIQAVRLMVSGMSVPGKHQLAAQHQNCGRPSFRTENPVVSSAPRRPCERGSSLTG